MRLSNLYSLWLGMSKHTKEVVLGIAISLVWSVVLLLGINLVVG